MLSEAILNMWENYLKKRNYLRVFNQGRFSEDKRIKFMEMLKGLEAESQDMPILQPIVKVKVGFAEETGFSFKLILSSDIGGMIIHETQKKVAELFEEAQRNAPCIICFDEIDAMVPRRISTSGIEYQNTEVNEFLVQMNNCGEKGIFIIGTTNNKDLIDPAALRTGRLDYHVEIPKPDRIQRTELFRVCLKNRPMESDIDFASLAMSTDGFTASDVAFVVNKAALAAAKTDLLILTDIVSRCISEVQKGRMKFDDATDTEDKTEYLDCQFQDAKKVIVS